MHEVNTSVAGSIPLYQELELKAVLLVHREVVKISINSILASAPTVIFPFFVSAYFH